MKVIEVSKNLFNPIPLPGMGRSVELSDVQPAEIADIRAEFARGELYIAFKDEPEDQLRVVQLWGNPHAPQITLFV